MTAVGVRSFATPSGVRRYTRTLELPGAPVPGHHVTVPGAATPLRVERVVLVVELTAEDTEGLEAALAGGWKAAVVVSEPESSRPTEKIHV